MLCSVLVFANALFWNLTLQNFCRAHLNVFGTSLQSLELYTEKVWAYIHTDSPSLPGLWAESPQFEGHTEANGVVRDALPENSTPPLCGFQGPKRAAQMKWEHWPKKLSLPCKTLVNFMKSMFLGWVYTVGSEIISNIVKLSKLGHE